LIEDVSDLRRQDAGINTSACCRIISLNSYFYGTYYYMKKTFFFLLFTFIVSASKAQLYITYLNNGAVCDSASATSYLLYNRTADSLWAASQFTMDGNVLFKATYKDAGLKTLHGLASYYWKAATGEYFVREKGFFINGLKEGIWAEYSYNGSVNWFITFKKDKKHGAFKMFHDENGNVSLEGEYVNDLKEGEWYTFNRDGDTLSTETFKEGLSIKKNNYPPDYKAPALSREFNSFIEKNLSKLLQDNKNTGNVLITCSLSPTGKIYDPKILGPGFNDAINAETVSLLPQAPACIPAYSNREGHSIKDSIAFYLHINKRSINTELKKYRITNTSDSSRNALQYAVPQPPGGLEKFFEYFALKFNAPPEAVKNNIGGRIILRFFVEPDGSLTEFEILRGIGYGCDEEAVRVLKQSPKWVPGIQNGKPQRVPFVLPVVFGVK